MDNVDILRAFQRRPDGTWLCIAPVAIATPHETVEAEPGQVFAFGETHGSLDVAEYLEHLGAQFGS